MNLEEEKKSEHHVLNMSTIRKDVFESKVEQRNGPDKTSNAQYAFCKVYFSAQRNKLRPILKFRKYYPVEHIFVPACSSARKIHFFKF